MAGDRPLVHGVGRQRSPTPAVRINEFAAGFGANGQTSNICVDSFAPILSTFAAQLAAHIPEHQR